MTRLVVVDAALLVLGAVYAAWLSRLNRGSPMSLFSGGSLSGRVTWVGLLLILVFVGGLAFASAGFGLGTSLINIAVVGAAFAAVRAGGAALHNRALDRR